MVPLRRARSNALLLSIMLLACTPQAEDRDVTLPEAATVTHRAVLIGEGGHEAMGTVSLYQGGDPIALFVVFADNFASSAPPHTFVTLGRKGVEGMTMLAPLRERRGRQTYQVSAAAAAFDAIWLWDGRADGPVALARLVRH